MNKSSKLLSNIDTEHWKHQSTLAENTNFKTQINQLSIQLYPKKTTLPPPPSQADDLTFDPTFNYILAGLSFSFLNYQVYFIINF